MASYSYVMRKRNMAQKAFSGLSVRADEIRDDDVDEIDSLDSDGEGMPLSKLTAAPINAKYLPLPLEDDDEYIGIDSVN